MCLYYVTISVLFYYVSVRSEFRIVMPVTISVLFYYVSVRSEFRIVMPVTISVCCSIMCLCLYVLSSVL